MKSYRELEVWKTGIELMKEIYGLVASLPPSEQYEMSSQMRRASTSILANIAEGFGRYTYADKANRYVISRGECSEVDAFIAMAIELEFLTRQQCERAIALIELERKLLSGLITASRSRY